MLARAPLSSDGATQAARRRPRPRLRRPDLVVRLTAGRLYHLEMQSTNDATMPWRILDSYSLLHQHDGQTPQHQVLSVGEASRVLASHIAAATLSCCLTHPRSQTCGVPLSLESVHGGAGEQRVQGAQGAARRARLRWRATRSRLRHLLVLLCKQ